jgi:oxygen-independent coproporphyrinogen III oxidase
VSPELGHLYVHIPFCRSRCAYCDFASEPIGRHTRAGRVGQYLEALRAELEARGGVASGDAGSFETIYLGGGTPTALPADALVGLVEELAARLGERRDRTSVAAGAAALLTPMDGAPSGGAVSSPPPPAASSPEFTVETNPGTIDAPLLERLRGAGVTRLSLGVQSFAPALRAALGRRVTQREIADALAAIAATDWQEWNLDLVFGIPGQTWNEAAADIDAAVAAGPTHISLYDLTYTPEFEARVNAAGIGAGARSRRLPPLRGFELRGGRP